MINIPDIKMNRMIERSFSPNDKFQNRLSIKSYLRKDKEKIEGIRKAILDNRTPEPNESPYKKAFSQTQTQGTFRSSYNVAAAGGTSKNFNKVGAVQDS